MKPRHPKYQLKKGDSIQSITEILGVEESVWKQYHNNMCRLDNIIRKELPSYLTEIFLLPELWEKENVLNSKPRIIDSQVVAPEKVRLGYQNTLFCKKVMLSQKYGVSISIQNENNTRNIKYEISLKWDETDDNIIVEVDKISPIYIDSRLADLMIESLAEDISGIIYPMSFVLNRSGEIIDISNFKEINKRWAEDQDNLRKSRIGETLEKYLRLTTDTLSNKKLLLERLHSDWFIHTFFLGIYQTYGNNYEIDKVVSFPFISGVKPFDFQSKMKVSEFLDEYNLIQVTAEGKLIDDRTQDDFDYKLNDSCFPDSRALEGSFYAKYFIDSKYYRIRNCLAQYKLNTKQEKRITIKIATI